MKAIKRKKSKGILDTNKDDAFELFISSTNIRFTFYKETHKILGNTFGVCVLQDFEALTPNLLARTIETVEGGGMVILLLKTIQSLKQLYTMTMVKKKNSQQIKSPVKSQKKKYRMCIPDSGHLHIKMLLEDLTKDSSCLWVLVQDVLLWTMN